ncbi:MAG: hypothetical protein RLZZ292_3872, partial [Bacteroidota bacterium]
MENAVYETLLNLPDIKVDEVSLNDKT